MSLGRGQMLMSVRQKIEHELEGRVCQYQMADYTNETIEKFCRQLVEKGADAYCKDAANHESGSVKYSGGMKAESCQFDDAIAVSQVASSGTESMVSDAEGSESSSNSLYAASVEQEASSAKSCTYQCHNSHGRSSNSPKKQPTSRLAVQWPSLPAQPQNEARDEYPPPTMGRGRRLQMVSKKTAAVGSTKPENEIFMQCDPSYTNDKIEDYLRKVIERNETGK